MKTPFSNFNKAKVLVIGDVMLDRYWSGSTSRISPEAPVPVVHVQQTEDRPGGAGNVALNLAALGCQVTLFGVCGQDAEADILENKLISANVSCHLHRSASFPTITKLRVLSLNQQLIRLDFEGKIVLDDSFNLVQLFSEKLLESDLVIFSDYGKGCSQYVHQCIAAANKLKKPIFIDPKGNDFSIYQHATLLTPNLREFENIVGFCQSEEELIRKGEALLQQYQLQALLITRGEKGMTLLRPQHPEIHLPAKAREVYDVTGAGDTVIATLGASYAEEKDLPKAAVLANLAAGIVVGKTGAATVSIPELRRAYQEEQSLGRGVMTEDQLLIAVEDARAHGERIVMTGGCFDILHAGHVSYLEEAKAYGDRLIIAVNDDESVAKLKGPARPINTLARRMAVLAGLSSVDWVVAFSETTPERIVKMVNPDVWVKGGDYRVADLPEGKSVLANGGQVKILKFVDDCSTSAIVERLQLDEQE